MINFIILESSENYIDYYTKIIRKYFYTSSELYDILVYSVYNKSLEDLLLKKDGPKIFLIDHNNKNNFNLYDRIKTVFHINSFIILFLDRINDFNYCNLRTISLYNIIIKNNLLLKEFYLTLGKLHAFLRKSKTYNFSSFDEIHRLPYDEIYYIQKESKEDYIVIFTKDNSYIEYNTINNIYKVFSEDPRFFKTHRSCIVNIDKISDYDRVTNMIFFNNGETTDLVCRRRKKMFCERLLK